jgi:hypothetical protein
MCRSRVAPQFALGHYAAVETVYQDRFEILIAAGRPLHQ